LPRGREETRRAAKQLATAPRISFTVMVAVLVVTTGMARMAERVGAAARMAEAVGTVKVVVVLAKSMLKLSS
jgi:hypothetical protein